MKHLQKATLVFLLVTMGFFSNADCHGIPAAEQSATNFTQDPVFKDYRGISLGMAADEVRQKLGKPEDQSDAEDTFEPAKGETARIVYSADKKVRTISIMYTDDISKAPKPAAMIGSDVSANEDGGVFKKVDYPDHGFWISYAKIAGDNPMIIIMIQAM